MGNSSNEETHQDMYSDAQVMNAYDFAEKHGWRNLKLYDNVQYNISKAVGGQEYVLKLLAQARKYVYDSPNLDFRLPRVQAWIGHYLDEVDRVLALNLLDGLNKPQPKKVEKGLPDDHSGRKPNGTTNIRDNQKVVTRS